MDVLVAVPLGLSPEQALALAQFVSWDSIREQAVDDVEAYSMRDALVELGRALGVAGYALL